MSARRYILIILYTNRIYTCQREGILITFYTNPIYKCQRVGILIGVLQAATSVQEMTLSFIPKLGAMILAIIIFGGWQLTVLVEFFREIFDRIPGIFT